MKPKISYIGKSSNKVDSISKVTGEAKYAGDLVMPGMLYAKVLRSPVPHAIIRSISTERAKALDGVMAVLTYKDVPDIPYTGTGHPFPDDTPLDTLILGQKVRYVGDAVAAVAAVTTEIAQNALELIEVEYEELLSYYDPEEAVNAQVEIHEGTGNVCASSGYEIGSLADGFKKSDLIVEDEFKTQIVQHCSMEGHTSLAYVDNNGFLVVYASTQIAFTLRRILGKALGMPISKIRVINCPVGGGFGSKQDVCQEPLNALLALKTRKPVLLELSRGENMTSTRTRHAVKFFLKSGVTKDGKLVARHMKIISNTGAYSSHGPVIALNIGNQFVLTYNTENIGFESVTSYTNLPVAGAMRGYGIPQLNFALESHMDNIAHELELDSLHFRRLNLYSPGSKVPFFKNEADPKPLEQCFNNGEKRSNWKDKKNIISNGRKKRGLGMACFTYPSCVWPFSQEIAGARIKVNEDGSAILYIGAADIGQGTSTAMAQIAADHSGIPFDKIHVVTADTGTCPFDLGSFASRQAFVSGNAVSKAALQCKHKLLELAGQQTGISPGDLNLNDGYIYEQNSGKQVIPLSKVTMSAYYNKNKPTTIESEAYYSPDHNVFSSGAVFVEVEVDLSLCLVNVQQIWSVHDSGVIINPLMAEGQIDGGVCMGLGYALTEELIVDRTNGRILNANMLDYKVLTIMDMPPVEKHFIKQKVGNAEIKSLGEPPILSVAPAIRNAVLDATGIAFNDLPINPEKIFRKVWKHEV